MPENRTRVLDTQVLDYALPMLRERIRPADDDTHAASELRALLYRHFHVVDSTGANRDEWAYHASGPGGPLLAEVREQLRG